MRSLAALAVNALRPADEILDGGAEDAAPFVRSERDCNEQPYATFIGPLSTTIVVGWEGVRKAWEMRFSQFDQVTISLAESHVHTNGNTAWAVGIEKVQLLRKDGK